MAYASGVSASTQVARNTRMSLACSHASARSADLPMPGAPRKTRPPPRPARADSSREPMARRSSSRNSNVVTGITRYVTRTGVAQWSQMNQQSVDAAPESRAVRVALWRALHVQLDQSPHVLEDEIGLKLVAPDADWRQRPDMEP